MRDFVENCVELFLVLILNIFAALYKLVTFFMVLMMMMNEFQINFYKIYYIREVFNLP